MAEIDDEKLEQMTKELDELRPFKDGVKKEEFEVKQREWTEEKTRLEQEAHPNWKKAREQIEVLEKIAKEKGVEFNEDGTVKTEEKFSRDDIVKAAEDATSRKFLSNRLDELLENYTAEDAAVVRKQYDKLTAGEEVTMQNIRSFVKSAEGAAGFKDSKIDRSHNPGGQGPREPKKEDTLDDEAAKDLASKIGIKI